MVGLYGLICRDGAPVSQDALNAMRLAMADWLRGDAAAWSDGPAGLGAPQIRAADGFVLAFAGRVDNRAELRRELRLENGDWEVAAPPSPISHLQSPISNPQSLPSDGELIFRACQKWGEACVERVYGDWSFAAWRPAERRLFLARDHFGVTSLYTYASPRVFAFASDYRALLALDPAPMAMDELYLAQMLISWPAYHGERTIYTPLKRLPPAHTATVTPDRLETRQYWFLERAPTLRLPRRQEYVEAFREVFDEAVRARLRPPEEFTAETQRSRRDPDTLRDLRVSGVNPPSLIGATLSGGLDSGAVVATAAGMLRTGGGRLAAFTSVPLADTGAYVGQRFGDEWPLAQVAAQFAGNVDLQAIPAAEVTPIQAIRRMLRIQGEPGHAAGNYHWMLALEQAAQDRGCRILLTGQMGNAGISWTGDVFSQPLAFQLRRMGWREWSKERVKRALPASVYAALQRARQGRRDWLRHTALRADVAARLNLMERRMNDAEAQPSRTPLEQRRWLRPGRSFIGALHAQMGAAHGLDVRDPTGDARVLAFTFSVPDWVFMDPASGLDRWLIRAAMQGRLPDDVRLNRRRGRQAGDLVPRLRASAAEVEAALDEIARGPGGGYVDVSRLRQAWAMIQAHDTPEAFQLAVTVLTRGVMAGLFVNEFDRSNG